MENTRKEVSSNWGKGNTVMEIFLGGKPLNMCIGRTSSRNIPVEKAI